MDGCQCNIWNNVSSPQMAQINLDQPWMDAAKYLFIPPAMGKKDTQAAMKGVFGWFMFQLQMFKQPDFFGSKCPVCANWKIRTGTRAETRPGTRLDTHCPTEEGRGASMMLWLKSCGKHPLLNQSLNCGEVFILDRDSKLATVFDFLLFSRSTEDDKGFLPYEGVKHDLHCYSKANIVFI